MALYPYSTVQPAEAALAAIAIPSGCMVVIPVDMTVRQVMQIILRQVSQTEDFCLRAWISLRPGGPSIGTFITMPVAVFTPAPLIIYVGEMDLPMNCYPVQVVPGTYTLNIQNLINQATAVAYSSIDS
jgi:hypothetical protein